MVVTVTSILNKKNSLVFVSKNNRICIYCACKVTKLTTLSSQGSAVTRLRCGGQCNKNFVANLLPNSTVKKFEDRLIFARVMDRNTEVPFLETQCSSMPTIQLHACSNQHVFKTAQFMNQHFKMTTLQ